jgi:hypothetical protein
VRHTRDERSCRQAVGDTSDMKCVTGAATLALTAALVAGCGGGADDQAKVEANLRHYLNGLPPEQTGFPIGLGRPQVKANSCRDRHVRVEKGDVFWSSTSFGVPHVGSEGALWGCVVNVGTYVARVNVLVGDRTRVVREWEGVLLKGKCLADLKAKGAPASAYGICTVTLPPID